MKVAAFVAGLLLSGSALAQMSPVGLWRTLDDKTGEAKAEVRVTEEGGVVSGRIERVVAKDAKPGEACVECSDERKDKPMVGLDIIRGVRKSAEQAGTWDGGRILDPQNGREYKVRLTPIDGGQRLQVRGSFGPFWRTQTWVRVQ